MKVEKKEIFSPITITLETEDEYLQMMDLVEERLVNEQKEYLSWCTPSPKFNFITELFDKLTYGKRKGLN